MNEIVTDIITPGQRRQLAASILLNLTENILPYWLEKMQDPAGGFYGRRDGFDRLDADAPKGAILNARILWTFAEAYRLTGNGEYLAAATRAYDYICARFIDGEYGGVFWSVNADGTPCDTKKQFYAIAFTLYGMAAYHAATGSEEALATAFRLFDCIEAHSLDTAKGGYIEAATRDWQPIGDMRLSDKDLNMAKTMNTHLHIIEAYSLLLKVTGDARVEEATRRLLRIFLDRIQMPNGHMGLFFDDDFHPADDACSYGHDIEASWLLLETAHNIGDPALTAETLEATRRMALAALEGMRPDGAMIYERHADGRLDTEIHWWVQAECLPGLLYLAVHHGMPEYFAAAATTWRYIEENLVDRREGEWYWSRRPDGEVNRLDDKAGFWKCPYHNSRACMEAAALLRNDNTNTH